jgi:hypothetical protein
MGRLRFAGAKALEVLDSTLQPSKSAADRFDSLAYGIPQSSRRRFRPEVNDELAARQRSFYSQTEFRHKIAPHQIDHRNIA